LSATYVIIINGSTVPCLPTFLANRGWNSSVSIRWRGGVMKYENLVLSIWVHLTHRKPVLSLTMRTTQ
ncbi:hypothetical protein L9F63_006931, partial [Diploptera punctata]